MRTLAKIALFAGFLFVGLGCIHDIDVSSEYGFPKVNGKCYELTHDTHVFPQNDAAEYSGVNFALNADSLPLSVNEQSEGLRLLPKGTRIRVIKLVTANAGDAAGMLIPIGRLLDGELAGHTLQLIGILEYELNNQWKLVRLHVCDEAIETRPASTTAASANKAGQVRLFKK